MNWSGWTTATHDEQQQMLASYRREVKRESDRARDTNYRAMDEALRTGAIGNRDAI
jgi:hypothetical protein